MFNANKAIDKLMLISKESNASMSDFPTFEELVEILLAGHTDEPEILASKTINGSSLGWMLDQIRKQDCRIARLEEQALIAGELIFQKSTTSVVFDQKCKNCGTFYPKGFDHKCKQESDEKPSAFIKIKRDVAEDLVIWADYQNFNIKSLMFKNGIEAIKQALK